MIPILVEFPIIHGNEGVAFDNAIYCWMDTLEPLENGLDPVKLSGESFTQLLFYRQEDLIAFRLKFGIL